MTRSLLDTDIKMLEALVDYSILDTVPEQIYNDLVFLASVTADAPIAMINLIGEEHVTSKACTGFKKSRIAREDSFCAHAVGNSENILQITDATMVEPFNRLPIVVNHGVRFYAGAPLVSPEGEMLGTLCVMDTVARRLDPTQERALRALARQVTEQLGISRRMIQIQQEEQRFKLFMDNSPAVAYMKDEHGVFRYVNQPMLDLTGLTLPEVLGKTDAQIWPAEVANVYREHDQAILAAGRAATLEEIGTPDEDGEPTWWHSTKFPIPGPRKMLGGISINISELKKVQADLHKMARFDTLTGLPNRNQMLEKLPEAIARAKRQNGEMVLMFMDLDHFKGINDTMGHQAGDELLKIFGQRVRESVRRSDMVFRIAGDEFLVVLEGVRHPEESEKIAEKILQSVNAPVVLGDTPHVPSASIGIARLGSGDMNFESLIARADAALYQAKAAGRNTYATAEAPD